MKLHARDPRSPTWSLCGAYGDTPMVDDPAEVTCGHCLRKLDPSVPTPRQQIDRLAQYIADHVPGEPSQSEGAVDCAIRLIGRLQSLQLTIDEEMQRLGADGQVETSDGLVLDTAAQLLHYLRAVPR